MAVVVHIVERVITGDNNLRNGVNGVILAIDNAVDTTDALIQARARTVLVAQGMDLPVGYFNTNRLASVLDAAGDHVCFAGPKVLDVVA